MKRIGAATLAASLSLGLVMTAGPATAGPAAKVTVSNLPSQSQIAKIYPSAAATEVTDSKGKKFEVPQKKCADSGTVKAKSVATRSLFPDFSPGAKIFVGAVQVGQFGSVKQAKGVVAKVAAYVKRCKSFTESDLRITTAKLKVKKVGHEVVAYKQTGTSDAIKVSSHTAVVRKGKRVALVSAAGQAELSVSQLNKFLKVTVKKMS